MPGRNSGTASPTPSTPFSARSTTTPRGVDPWTPSTAFWAKPTRRGAVRGRLGRSGGARRGPAPRPAAAAADGGDPVQLIGGDVCRLRAAARRRGWRPTGARRLRPHSRHRADRRDARCRARLRPPDGGLPGIRPHGRHPPLDRRTGPARRRRLLRHTGRRGRHGSGHRGADPAPRPAQDPADSSDDDHPRAGGRHRHHAGHRRLRLGHRLQPAPSVVVAEMAMVLAALAGATVLARRLSLREGRTDSDTSHPEATRVKPA